MGLGGYLCWTALAREIKLKYGVKCIPMEVHGTTIKLIKSPIFFNNRNIIQNFDGTPGVQMILNHPASNYCIQDTPQKAFHKSDKHIIETICEPYGIKNPKIKCEIFLSDEEVESVNTFTKQLSDNFIAIEPHSKTNYTPNRAYPVEKWQKIVNQLSKSIEIVQVGTEGPVLNNVTDMTGKTTFREAAGIIGKSQLFLANESGLVHAASAFDAKTLVVITGYQTKKMVSYPNNINIDISNHSPCGLKIVCPQCADEAKNHNESVITEKILEELCL